MLVVTSPKYTKEPNSQFEPDEPVPNGCGDCTRCITGCPTGALLGDGRMNAQKCLSSPKYTKEPNSSVISRPFLPMNPKPAR
jgi:epoxyqueuosine reductase QueG